MFQDSLKNRWISYEYITTKEMMKPSLINFGLLFKGGDVSNPPKKGDVSSKVSKMQNGPKWMVQNDPTLEDYHQILQQTICQLPTFVSTISTYWSILWHWFPSSIKKKEVSYKKNGFPKTTKCFTHCFFTKKNITKTHTHTSSEFVS